VQTTKQITKMITVTINMTTIATNNTIHKCPLSMSASVSSATYNTYNNSLLPHILCGNNNDSNNNNIASISTAQRMNCPQLCSQQFKQICLQSSRKSLQRNRRIANVSWQTVPQNRTNDRKVVCGVQSWFLERDIGYRQTEGAICPPQL